MVRKWMAGLAAVMRLASRRGRYGEEEKPGSSGVTLECTEQKESGVPGMSRYTTQKNKKNTSGRVELMKYNKFLRRHTLHREIK